MTRSWRSFGLMLATATLSAGLFWLLRNHWGHAAGLAPYLLFLACPPAHLVLHRGYRDGVRRERPAPPRQTRAAWPASDL
jgi:hypothetical protein